METPLDVLSMAATLIHDQLNKANKNKDDRDRSVERDSASTAGQKELPTRIKKERRRHERHHDLISSAARARKERLVPDVDDSDRPLDMTVNRRCSPPPYSSSVGGVATGASYPMRYPSPPDYSGRPSVITCATSVRSSPAPSCPSPCGSTGSARSATTLSGSSPPRPSAADAEAGNSRPHRREIISSGVCDPVIDEHFRRSLGERYSHLFASSSPGSPSSSSGSAAHGAGGASDPASLSAASRDGATAANKLPSTLNVTGLSVDDHFAKALGETWLKLQSETKEKEASADPQPGSPLSSSAQRQGLLLT